MIECIICFVAGLILGWNVLPQPKFVKDIYDKIAGMFG